MIREYGFYAKKTFVMVSGFFLMALGNVITLESGLGVGPWAVLHTGISNHTPMTFGQASQLVGLLLIIISYFLGIKPAIGTVAGMVLFGIFFDYINSAGIIPDVTTEIFSFVYIVLGAALVGVGSGIYMNTGLGTGPRDSLMLGLYKRLGLRIGSTRTVIEVTVLIIGYFLGGPVGVGTLIYAMSVGHFLEWALKHLNPFPSRDFSSSTQH